MLCGDEPLEINSSISEEAKLKFLSLFKDSINSWPKFADIIETCLFLCKKCLQTELSLVYERQEFHSNSEDMKTYNIMLGTGIAYSYIDVLTLQIILTTPMITAEHKRCFSTLNELRVS